MPPPLNVLALALVKLIVPVPVMARFVAFICVQAKDDAAIVTVAPPNANTLLLDVVPTARFPVPVSAVLYPAKSIVPEIRLNAVVVLEFVAKESCSVTEPLGVLIAKT